MDWITFLVALGAVARLTRLVTGDAIMQGFRDRMEQTYVARINRERAGWIVRHFDWGYLVTCPWCTSIYISAVVAPVAVFWGDNRVVFAALLALTASLVAGHIQAREPE